MIYTKQRCNKCNELKIVTEFPPTKLIGGVQKYGKTCLCCLQAVTKTKEQKSVKPKKILESLENIEQSRDTRTCIVCNKTKSISEFFKDRVSNGIQRYRGECKKCSIEASKERTKKYREAKSNVASDLTTEQWERTCLFFADECAYCGGKVEEQEHLVAVSKGGGYTQSNIVPSCKRCNTSKGGQDLAKWYIQVPWFSKERLNRIVEYIKLFESEEDNE